MSDNVEKRPLSKEWLDTLDKGRAMIDSAKKGQLVKLLKGFPKDMEIPQSFLTLVDNSAVANNFIQVAAGKGYLRQIADIAKKYDIDVTPALRQKNNWGNNFLHIAARDSFAINRATFMLKELNFDIKPLLEEKNNIGETFLDVAINNSEGISNIKKIVIMAKELNFDLRPLLDKKDDKGRNTFAKVFEGKGVGFAAKFCKEVGTELTLEMFGEERKLIGAVFLGQINEMQKQRKIKGEPPFSLNDISVKDRLLEEAIVFESILNVKGFSDKPKDIKEFWERMPERFRNKPENDKIYKNKLKGAIASSISINIQASR